MRPRFIAILAALALMPVACNKEKTNEPDAGSNLLGPTVQQEEELGGDDEEGADGLGMSDEAPTEEPVEEVAAADPKAEKGPKLPPRAEPKEKCTGKGKKRACKLVDPKPQVSASYGVVALMNDYKWGMSPEEVFKVLTKDIEADYEKRNAKAKDAMEQDRLAKWRKEQLQRVKANHIKFVRASNHRWGVSLIQFEYADDNGEEMLWIANEKGLRKFYFFKDGQLWKILYAYATDAWPGKSYAEVVDQQFKKWFGVSPAEKSKKDPKNGQVVLAYNEWTAMKGEKIRSFDMTSVHGVIALAVVDGSAEKSIGERLPNVGREEKVEGVVNDVLGGSDVCYDKSGSIVECGGGKVEIK